MEQRVDGGGAERRRTIARWLLASFYAVAGVGHLLATDAMVRIVPDWVPFPHAVVIATGVCELAGVVALLTPRWRRLAGWAFAAYAVCVYPANVKHAIHDLGTGTGLPIWYHGPRLLLQPLIVWWALWASGAVTLRRR
ncbi:DoxX family protein [Sphingomonas bacterium]|uniref:DoxX family protein n=1 Tax=Sphingomonas bacterium TaxID=1895847 RepID=UPI0015765A20|nr:DoxX family protein [Sphingomonas bacterium]